MATNANQLCKGRADSFNSSPHANLSSIKGKGRRTVHHLNFPLCYQPTACDFSFHLNQNFSRRDCGRVVKTERAVVLAETPAEGKENTQEADEEMTVNIYWWHSCHHLIWNNCLLTTQKHFWERWYGNPSISLPWHLLHPASLVHKLRWCFACWSAKTAQSLKLFPCPVYSKITIFFTTGIYMNSAKCLGLWRTKSPRCAKKIKKQPKRM